MRTGLIIFILCLFASCSKKKDQQIADAIDIAQSHLSEGDCDEALKVLGDVSGGEEDPVYLQVLASAYACRANFSEITFIVTDVPLIDTSPTTDLFKSLTVLTLSDETETDSAEYEDLKTAINTLLQGKTQTERAAEFGTRKAGDIGTQVLFLTIVQLGKFLNWYGNVDATGAKSLGTGTNQCILDYSYANAQAVVAAYPVANHCNSNVGGHPDLDLTTAAGRTRACEGLMLLTNLIDVLDNIDISGSTELAPLTSVATEVNTYKTTATTADPTLATLLGTTSQSACETLLGTAAEVNRMQYIYSLIFEAGLQ